MRVCTLLDLHNENCCPYGVGFTVLLEFEIIYGVEYSVNAVTLY
jgi:hypothetical protein